MDDFTTGFESSFINNPDMSDVSNHQAGQRWAYEQSHTTRVNMEPFEMGQFNQNYNMNNDFLLFEETHSRIMDMQFRNMLCNLFVYRNKPDTLNTSQLEVLLRSFAGGGVAVGLNELGEMVIKGRVTQLGFNIYGDLLPAEWEMANSEVNTSNIITNTNLDGDYVVFFNKMSYIDFFSSDFAIINHYARQLGTIKATQRMNIMQMRTPYLLKTNKNGVSGQILQKKFMSGDMFIEVDDATSYDTNINVLPTQVPDRIATLQMSYRDTLNEMLTLFGIYNNPEVKRERLISGETSANNHIIEAMGDIYYNARRQAVELLNLAFGTNIVVEWNSTVAATFRGLLVRDPAENIYGG